MMGGMASEQNETDRTVPVGGYPDGETPSNPAASPLRRHTMVESETRHAAVTATVDLLLRAGYRGITMEAVARSANISKSTLYRHWPNKAHLVLDAYTYRTNVDTAVRDTGDVRADLAAYLAKLAYSLNFRGAAAIVSELILEANRSDEFALLYRSTLLRDRRGVFLAIFLRAERRGQVRTGLDWGTVIDAAYGAIHHRLIVSGQSIDGEFVENLTTVLLDGITVR